MQEYKAKYGICMHSFAALHYGTLGCATSPCKYAHLCFLMCSIYLNAMWLYKWGPTLT